MPRIAKSTTGPIASKAICLRIDPEKNRASIILRFPVITTIYQSAVATFSLAAHKMLLNCLHATQ
jgi:hypothetical protein